MDKQSGLAKPTAPLAKQWQPAQRGKAGILAVRQISRLCPSFKIFEFNPNQVDGVSVKRFNSDNICATFERGIVEIKTQSAFGISVFFWYGRFFEPFGVEPVQLHSQFRSFDFAEIRILLKSHIYAGLSGLVKGRFFAEFDF